MVTDSGKAVVVFGFKDNAGSLDFYYDKDSVFKNIQLHTKAGMYENKKKFPATSNFLLLKPISIHSVNFLIMM